MTEINPLLNGTLAGKIAQELDKKDGNKDGKIEASVWNQFVADKGGEMLGEGESIKVENDAINKITKYVIRQAKTAGNKVNNLAKEWLNTEKEANNNQTVPVEENPPVDGVASVKDVAPVKGTEKPAPVTRPADAPPLHETPPDFNVAKKGKDYSQVSLDNIIKAEQMQYKEVVNNRFSGKDVAKKYEKYLSTGGTFISSATKDNVAYVADKLLSDKAIKNNIASVNVVSSMLKPLIARAKELKISTNLTEKSKPLDRETLVSIRILVKAIIAREDSIENRYLAFASIKQPAKTMAGKTIIDKATGNVYKYDEEGYIENIKDKNGKLILENWGDGECSYYNKNMEFHFRKNGKLECTHECPKINGSSVNISRRADGTLKEISGTLSKDKSISMYYDCKGNCIKYSSHNHDFTAIEWRKSDGTLYQYCNEYIDENNSRIFEHKDANGNLIKYSKLLHGDGPVYYYNGNGKEISEEEYDKL